MANKTVFVLLLANVVGVFGASYTNADGLIVETRNGLVRGEQGGILPKTKSPWFRFRGIPYAEPPVGGYRFEYPVRKLPWEGVLNATKKGDACIQGTDPVEGSEDCLNLKIITPKLPNKNNKLPVLVWIYGGAFTEGAADFEKANPELLMCEGVMVVSFHYRLGLFGFLSTGDKVVPGNAGLKDQILALEWIKDNIENFGGDPDKITLIGQSAGAVSIGYMLQAAQTKGLYSGAIMLSGNPLNSWALSRNPLNFAKSVASNLRISTSNVQQMVEALKEARVEDIQRETTNAYNKALMSDPFGGLPLGPVIEPDSIDAVVTGRSHDLLSKGQFNKVPILIGHTSLESRTGDELSSAIKLLLTTYGLIPGRLVPAGMNVASNLQRSSIGQKIKSEYFGSASITSNDRKAMLMISDDQFVRGINEAVRLYSKQVPVYYYSFSHEGSLFGIANRTLRGVGHNEDMGYLFDFGHRGSTTDYTVRNRYIRLLANFAKYRNPTPNRDSLLDNVQWPANNGNTEIKQLSISNKLEIVTNPNNEKMSFWRNIFNQNGNPPFDTY